MILAEVVSILFFLGTSPNCEGKGICKMQIQLEKDTTKCDNCVPAWIGTYEDGLALAITESEIKDEVFLKYFTESYFEVPYDYTIPKEISDLLGLKKEYVIKKGKYKFNESATDIVLIF